MADSLFSNRHLASLSQHNWAGLCLLFLMALLAIKNVNLASPIMAGDEYAYFARSREFPATDAVLAYDPTIQATNNVFYFWIGHILWNHTADPALSMRVIQTFLYCLILTIIFYICRFFMSVGKSAVITVAAACTAMSSYTAYFMPETVYQFLFFVVVCAVVSLLPRWTIFGSIVCGFLVALMMLTKPHGIAAGFSVALCLSAIAAFPCVFLIPRRRSVPALVIFGPATYIALVGINVGLSGRWQYDPRFFVGDFYENLLTSGQQSILPPLRLLVPVIVGNGTALAILVGLPLVYVAIFLLRRLSHGPSCNQSAEAGLRQSRFAVLAVLSSCMLISAVAMTISFTAKIGVTLPSEVWRIHGRYYSFTLTLCVVAMFAAAELRPSWPTKASSDPVILRLTAVFVIGCLGIAHFWWRNAFSLAPWDFPEIWALTPNGWLADANKVSTSILAFGAICFLAIALRPRMAPMLFIFFYAVLNISSLVQTTRWQFAHGNGSFSPYSAPASALRILLGPKLVDRGIVIGPDRGLLAYTLFALRSRSRVMLLPHESVVDSNAIGPLPLWVLAQGPYDLHLNGTVVFRTNELTLVMISANASLADHPRFYPDHDSRLEPEKGAP